MPVGLLAVLVVEGEDLQRAVLRKRGAQVLYLAVYSGGAGGLVEPHADGLGHLGWGHARLKFLWLAFQVDSDHSFSPFRRDGHNKNAALSIRVRIANSAWGDASLRIKEFKAHRGSTRIQDVRLREVSSSWRVTAPPARPFGGCSKVVPGPPPLPALSAVGAGSLARGHEGPGFLFTAFLLCLKL